MTGKPADGNGPGQAGRVSLLSGPVRGPVLRVPVFAGFRVREIGRGRGLLRMVCRPVAATGKRFCTDVSVFRR